MVRWQWLEPAIEDAFGPVRPRRRGSVFSFRAGRIGQSFGARNTTPTDRTMLLATLLVAIILTGEPPAVAPAPRPARPEPLPGFHRSAWFGEQVREAWVAPGVRAIVTAPGCVDPTRPTRFVVYATPNGSTIEQTLGSRHAPGTHWHFDIQHIAAQVRRLREVSPGENVVLACVEAEGLSWPAWQRAHPDGPATVRRVVAGLVEGIPGRSVRITLAGHSGGGSFLFAYLDAADTLPAEIDRIAFLDANYSYRDADRHGDKLLAWLRGGLDRQLVVIAYDDREITLNGKRVVGADGGTFRATRRMLDRFARDLPLTEREAGPVTTTTGLDSRILVHVHRNPDNRILHTALVGEMNGVLEALTTGRKDVSGWGGFGGRRAYSEWIQPAVGIPPRPVDAPGGAAVLAAVEKLPPADREEALARELIRGNLPDFLRRFRSITVRGRDSAGGEHTAAFEVMPDYLAVGSDTDFVRVPLTPATAQRVADAFGCSLPTRKVVDEVYRTAEVKLEPRPLTERREAVATFVGHHAIIQEQLAGYPSGRLVAGIKKDLVVTNRLAEKPNRAAIYGWHKPDGAPIQPLTIVHRDTYVDYSHGARLLRRAVVVDGTARDVRHVLYAADLCILLSDEGPVTRPSY